MSPRIIHLPLSGRDRRRYVRELRLAEQAHRALPDRVEEAAARRPASRNHEPTRSEYLAAVEKMQSPKWRRNQQAWHQALGPP